MKKSIIAAAALAAGGVSGVAMAGPSWTYLDLGFVQGEEIGEDSDAFQLRGSFGIDMWHARLEYIDGESFDVDFDGYRLAIGAHPAITENTDLVFELSYFDLESDLGDADGYGLAVGVRSMFTDNVELNALLQSDFGDIDGGGDITSINASLGGQYLFTDNVGVGVDVSIGDGNAANFYVRWSF